MSIKIDDDDYNDDEKSSKEEEAKEDDTEQCLLLLEKYSTRTLATSAAQIISTCIKKLGCKKSGLSRYELSYE